MSHLQGVILLEEGRGINTALDGLPKEGK